MADSTDGGSSFGPSYQQADLPEPVSGCAGSALSVGSAVLFSGPAGATEMRTNTTIRRSDDGGRTYQRSLQVWAGPGGYSTLARLPAGSGSMSTDQVGLAFERGSGDWAGGCWGAACRISFAHVPLDLRRDPGQ